MARFLLACYPIAGHLNPNMAVAHALRERGHQVAVYSGQLARDAVERAGFVFFGYQEEMDRCLMGVLLPSQQQHSAGQITSGFKPLAKLKQTQTLLHEWFLRTVHDQVADLRRVIRQWQPDALCTDLSLFGPILVLAETESIPVAVLNVLPACSIPGPEAPVWGRGLPPPRTIVSRMQSLLEGVVQDRVLASFRADVNTIRQAYGLPALTETVMAFAGRLPLYMVTGTPELDYNRRDLPPSVHYVGACLPVQNSNTTAPDWLAALPGPRPVVHVTEGTIHTNRPLVLRAATRGLAGLNIDVVITTGAHRDAASLELGPPAPNIRIEQFVAHSELLPRCQVVVTTGGAGTILSALIHEVPLVVVPIDWDKPENARRVADAGVGVRLPPAQCTPRGLRAAVMRVLNNPRYRDSARSVGAALRQRGGASRAAELLEHMQASNAANGHTKGEAML